MVASAKEEKGEKEGRRGEGTEVERGRRRGEGRGGEGGRRGGHKS